MEQNLNFCVAHQFLAKLLLNWFCLPNKCWDTEVCSRERVYLQGNQARRQKNKSQVLSPQRQEAWGINVWRVWGGRRCRIRWREAGKRWDNQCSEQACRSHKLLHGTHTQKMVALTWSEKGVSSLLTSEGHPSDTCIGLAEWLVVSTSFNWARVAPCFLYTT